MPKPPDTLGTLLRIFCPPRCCSKTTFAYRVTRCSSGFAGRSLSRCPRLFGRCFTVPWSIDFLLYGSSYFIRPEHRGNVFRGLGLSRDLIVKNHRQANGYVPLFSLIAFGVTNNSQLPDRNITRVSRNVRFLLASTRFTF